MDDRIRAKRKQQLRELDHATRMAVQAVADIIMGSSKTDYDGMRMLLDKLETWWRLGSDEGTYHPMVDVSSGRTRDVVDLTELYPSAMYLSDDGYLRVMLSHTTSWEKRVILAYPMWRSDRQSVVKNGVTRVYGADTYESVVPILIRGGKLSMFMTRRGRVV